MWKMSLILKRSSPFQFACGNCVNIHGVRSIFPVVLRSGQHEYTSYRQRITLQHYVCLCSLFERKYLSNTELDHALACPFEHFISSFQELLSCGHIILQFWSAMEDNYWKLQSLDLPVQCQWSCLVLITLRKDITFCWENQWIDHGSFSTGISTRDQESTSCQHIQTLFECVFANLWMIRKWHHSGQNLIQNVL